MIKHKNVVNAFLIGLISIVSLVGLSGATIVSVTVPPGEEVTRKIDLEVDDRVRVQFTVEGIKNNLISFSIVYPNATEIHFGEIGKLGHDLVCDVKGEYTMFFVNNDMTDSKLVTLNYEIEHYMFGMPQTLFLVIIIVVLCIAMVAAFILLSPPM